MTTNDTNYKTFTILTNIKGLAERVEIVAIDLESAKSDFNQAFGLENAKGSWGCKEGW